MPGNLGKISSGQRKSLTKRQVVDASARKHGVPEWLLWGIFGAESTFGTNGNNYFGLIEPEYKMANGNIRRPKHTDDIFESSDIAAELLASLKQEHGSWAAAVAQYAPYSISHPKELSQQGSSEGKETAESKFFQFKTPKEQKEFEKLAGEENLKSGFEIGGVNPLDSLKDIGAVFLGAGELLFTPEGWLRLGKLIGGAILFLWGLNVLVQGSKVAGKTSSGINKALEIAAVVK
jgi:hypothetical protein